MEQITINLLATGVTPVCHVSQFDDGRTVRINLKKGAEVYALSGTEEVKMRIRKPDDTERVINITNTASSYVDYVSVPEDCDIEGVNVCELVIDDLGSKNFLMKVEEDAYGGGANVETLTASGSIATFETNMVDNLVDLKADINPVQDLHGYDAPWIGGAGKNKCKPLDNPVTRSSGITVTPQADGSVILNGTQVGSSGTVITAECYIKQGVTYIASIGNYDTNIIDFGIQGFGHVKKVTLSSDFNSYGVQVYITEGTTLNNVRLYPQIEEGSTATDWTPYENICPITGWDEVNVEHCGKNLIDYEHLEWTSGLRDDDGIVTPSSASHFTNPIRVNPNENYTISGTLRSSSTAWRIYFLDKYQNWISRTSSLNVTNNYTFLTPINCEYVQFQCINTIDYSDAQLELGSTATDYESYSGTAVTVQFGQTVFSGTINLTTGLLTITHKKIVISSDTTGTWQWFSNYKQAYIENVISDYPAVRYLYEARLMCDKLKPIGVNYRNGNNGNFACIILSGNGLAFGTKYDTLEDFRVWLANNPITVVYELAEPIEIQLTPQQIEAFVGTNVIYADTGDVELKYLKQV